MIKPYTFLISSALNLIFHWTSHNAFWDCRETQAAYLNSLYHLEQPSHQESIYLYLLWKRRRRRRFIYIAPFHSSRSLYLHVPFKLISLCLKQLHSLSVSIWHKTVAKANPSCEGFNGEPKYPVPEHLLMKHITQMTSPLLPLRPTSPWRMCHHKQQIVI